MTSTLASQLIVVLIVCAAVGYVGLVVVRALRSLRRREKGSACGSGCGCGEPAAPATRWPSAGAGAGSPDAPHSIRKR